MEWNNDFTGMQVFASRLPQWCSLSYERARLHYGVTCLDVLSLAEFVPGAGYRDGAAYIKGSAGLPFAKPDMLSTDNVGVV